MTSPAVGFVGLGQMGGPMAANLVAAGHEVRGFDLSPTALQAARDAGVIVAASAAEAARGADVVITMLPSGRHVVDVLSGEDGLLAHLDPTALHIDCSTIDIASARLAHDAARERGIASVDAPVSGGVVGARAATLTFMAGGSDKAFGRAEPVLARMGRAVIHCGAAGAGQAAKICNNMLLGISMIGVCEAFVLADALGLTDDALFAVASKSSGQCWALTTNCPVPGPVPGSPANNDYQPGFRAALMLKDLSLSQKAASDAGVATDLGRRALELYQRYTADRGGDEDFSGIVRWISGQTEPSIPGATAR
jgi:3-hydroxyisobutyrate dehydrogenase